MSEIVITEIPKGGYLSKSEAAKALGIPASNLQYHIKQGNIKSILIPGMGHILNYWDVYEFKGQIPKPGKPSIYEKVTK